MFQGCGGQGDLQEQLDTLKGRFTLVLQNSRTQEKNLAALQSAKERADTDASTYKQQVEAAAQQIAQLKEELEEAKVRHDGEQHVSILTVTL